MTRNLMIAGGFGLVLIVVLVIVLFPRSETVDTQPLDNTFESNAFSFSYPANWEYQIPQPNLLFLASADVLAEQPGATMTIQRTVALVDDTLAAALTTYLERGPLLDPNWSINGEAQSLEIGGYPALTVQVEQEQSAVETPMRAEIYLLRADSGFAFIFTTTAPIAQWSQLEDTFAQIIASIEILE